MAARILDGKALSKELNQALKARVAALPRPPGITVVRVGSDPASEVYVTKKEKTAQALGLRGEHIHLPADVAQIDLEALILRLNRDDRVDGILVQLPLPRHLDEKAVLDLIAPEKDVDGFHPHNMGLLAQGRPRFVACTPWGCMKLLESAGVELGGKEAVVVGRSNIVGRPMAMLLEAANATVTVCHSRTKDLEAHVRRADILVAAIGRARFISGAWVKPGAVVIDVGINRLEDGSLVGDVDFEGAVERASAITPVPGGVGPMTIAMLMANTEKAARLRLGA